MSEGKKSPSYLARALNGKYEPEYPKIEAFEQLESILGDTISLSLTIGNIARLALRYAALNEEEKEYADTLIQEQRDKLTKIHDSIAEVIKRAREIEDGDD